MFAVPAAYLRLDTAVITGSDESTGDGLFVAGAR